MLFFAIPFSNYNVWDSEPDPCRAFCADTMPCKGPQPSLVRCFWSYRDRELSGEEVTGHCQEQLMQILITILLEINLFSLIQKLRGLFPLGPMSVMRKAILI